MNSHCKNDNNVEVHIFSIALPKMYLGCIDVFIRSYSEVVRDFKEITFLHRRLKYNLRLIRTGMTFYHNSFKNK